MIEKRGLFIVIDGIDGVGKGVVERALIEYEQKEGRAVFDTIAFSRANRKGLPELIDFWNPPKTYYDVVVTAEPTYEGMGHSIRDEIISMKSKLNGRFYSAEAEIQAYSLNRLIQMQRTVIPALKNGLRNIQSRCLAATLTYQSLRAEEEGKNSNEIRERILNLEGNILQLNWCPDLLIIPTMKDIDNTIERIEKRKETQKDDNSIFDEKSFQEKLNDLYQSDWLRKIFESRGTNVKYLNAGISVDSTREQALSIYKEFLSKRN